MLIPSLTEEYSKVWSSDFSRDPLYLEHMCGTSLSSKKAVITVRNVASAAVEPLKKLGQIFMGAGAVTLLAQISVITLDILAKTFSVGMLSLVPIAQSIFITSAACFIIGICLVELGNACFYISKVANRAIDEYVREAEGDSYKDFLLGKICQCNDPDIEKRLNLIYQAQRYCAWKILSIVDLKPACLDLVYQQVCIGQYGKALDLIPRRCTRAEREAALTEIQRKCREQLRLDDRASLSPIVDEDWDGISDIDDQAYDDALRVRRLQLVYKISDWLKTNWDQIFAEYRKRMNAKNATNVYPDERQLGFLFTVGADEPDKLELSSDIRSFMGSEGSSTVRAVRFLQYKDKQLGSNWKPLYLDMMKEWIDPEEV